jgi:hypothetical protein
MGINIRSKRATPMHVRQYTALRTRLHLDGFERPSIEQHLMNLPVLPSAKVTIARRKAEAHV